jgi:CheY-like chemotaxis protein
MSKTVLSIEDDDAVEMLLQIAFRETARDFRVVRVPNGEEGLAFLRRSGRYANAQRPDLVLLNVNMPGISGPEVLRQMKDDESLRDIPTVVFTSPTWTRIAPNVSRSVRKTSFQSLAASRVSFRPLGPHVLTSRNELTASGKRAELRALCTAL